MKGRALAKASQPMNDATFGASQEAIKARNRNPVRE
jgi:hypothetical protein